MSEDTECPTCGRDDFESPQGMRYHHTRTHGESLLDDRECAFCGDSFDASQAGQEYCSRDCAAADRRKTLTKTCPECGDTFETPPSDDTIHCSAQCAGTSRAQQTTSTCEYCGESFEHAPYYQRRFCSDECCHAFQSEEYRERQQAVCQQCGQTFHTTPSDDSNYCCSQCFQEARTDRPRPDHPVILIWLLYEYEDHNQIETYRRQRAVNGHDDCLRQADVDEILEGLGIKRQQGSAKFQRELRDADPDELLGELPGASDGDDDWREYYQRGDADA